MSARSDLSLSFLDLVTCGFGGVTLLFLILLAVQGALVEQAPSAATGARQRLVSPWVIVIEAEPETSGSLWLDPTRDPWLITPPRDFSPSTGYGPRQAIIVLPQSPDGKWTARLGPVSPEARFRVRFIRGGVLREFDNQTPGDWNVDDQGQVAIWPSLSSRDKEGGGS